VHRSLSSRCRASLFAALAVSACSRSSSDQARDAEGEVRSWDATLRLMAESEAAGALPKPFAAELRRAIAMGKAQAETKLEKARSR
jgi:hypothetical protein